MTLGRQSHVPAISFHSEWHEAKPRDDVILSVRRSFSSFWTLLRLVVIGIPLNCFFFQQGVQAAHPVLRQRRHWMCAGEINRGRRIDVPAGKETYVEHKLSTSLFPSVKG